MNDEELKKRAEKMYQEWCEAVRRAYDLLEAL